MLFRQMKSSWPYSQVPYSFSLSLCVLLFLLISSLYLLSLLFSVSSNLLISLIIYIFIYLLHLLFTLLITISKFLSLRQFTVFFLSSSKNSRQRGEMATKKIQNLKKNFYRGFNFPLFLILNNNFEKFKNKIFIFMSCARSYFFLPSRSSVYSFLFGLY